MSRFKRLANLRRIREEAYGMAYAHILAKIKSLQQDVTKLDEVTGEEYAIARQTVGQGDSLPPRMVDDFFRGQSWRRKKLEQVISATQKDLDKTKGLWLAARVQLKQAEKLAEKEAQQQRHETEKRERKAMDMIGIMRNKTFSGQEGAFL